LLRQNPTSKRLINIDTDYGGQLARELDGCITLSLQEESADFYVSRVDYGSTGTRFTVRHQGFGVIVNSPLLGAYNVDNALAALAAVTVNGTPLATAAQLLKSVAQIPGRMERFQLRDGGTLIVDYAHTPDAFDKLYQEIERLDYRRVITVFGAGGERDRQKRPVMGELACRNSELVFLTDDNPRREDPARIVEDILTGCSRGSVEIIHDRTEAITAALSHAGAGTVVLLLGKGHETYQVIGEEKHYLNEREIIAPYTL
ncbi:UDP-N-acetylmuramoyl-L-alanyl-D-glutamate--2,6-diaminopimelate ligase, partial [bacterium]|nr:UDP-N-acetylmuramoyl-L-alanyl-D-glutamate--2,6-diaminopimelate ligase [bacterium]